VDKLKKLFPAFLALFPLSASAISMLAIGGIAAGGGIIGFSIYRSFAPVDMSGALTFFSSCWTCGMFGGVVASLSDFVPRIYRAVGLAVIPISLGLAAVWVAWTVISSWIGAKGAEVDMKKEGGAWTLAEKFGILLVKLIFVSALLLAPLPKIIGGALIEPVFNTGLSLGRGAADRFADEGNRHAFEACIIATAIAEGSTGSPDGIFSPRLRHNLTCQLGGIHKMTGLGMTVGWTLLNSAFDVRYMHTFLWDIPIFPNMGLIAAGAIIIFLFFMALLPIPMYFLETIMRISLDLIMLPLFLLGWVFSDWKVMPGAKGEKIKGMIDDLVKNTVGIVAVAVLVVFAVMFLNAMFGEFQGSDLLQTALENNDSRYLMDGLTLQNTSLVTIIMAGLFIGFFMTSIPAIINNLFKGIKVPEEYYNKAKEQGKGLWSGVKKTYAGLQK